MDFMGRGSFCKVEFSVVLGLGFLTLWSVQREKHVYELHIRSTSKRRGNVYTDQSFWIAKLPY